MLFLIFVDTRSKRGDSPTSVWEESLDWPPPTSPKMAASSWIWCVVPLPSNPESGIWNISYATLQSIGVFLYGFNLKHNSLLPFFLLPCSPLFHLCIKFIKFYKTSHEHKRMVFTRKLQNFSKNSLNDIGTRGPRTILLIWITLAHIWILSIYICM